MLFRVSLLLLPLLFARIAFAYGEIEARQDLKCLGQSIRERWRNESVAYQEGTDAVPFNDRIASSRWFNYGGEAHTCAGILKKRELTEAYSKTRNLPGSSDFFAIEDAIRAADAQSMRWLVNTAAMPTLNQTHDLFTMSIRNSACFNPSQASSPNCQEQIDLLIGLEFVLSKISAAYIGADETYQIPKERASIAGALGEVVIEPGEHAQLCFLAYLERKEPVYLTIARNGLAEHYKSLKEKTDFQSDQHPYINMNLWRLDFWNFRATQLGETNLPPDESVGNLVKMAELMTLPENFGPIAA